MSVRRGSGSGDLQIRTVQGANRVDHTGAADFTEVRDTELLSIQPPPGVDWEVHQIRMMGNVRARNAIGAGNDTAQAFQSEVALTFGDEIVDDFDSLGNVRPGKQSKNWLGADDHVLYEAGQVYPAQTRAPTDGTGPNQQLPMRFEQERNYADVPKLNLEDTEELTLIGANDNAIGNDYAEGGEVTAEYVGAVQVAYIPRDS